MDPNSYFQQKYVWEPSYSSHACDDETIFETWYSCEAQVDLKLKIFLS